MRIPNSLVSLVEEGLLEEVVRPLMSGKEAEVFLVLSGGELRVAKVYKEAQNRTFKNRAEYTEGRKVRNSRDQRAMDKRSRYGRAEDESAWRSTEVDMIYRLRDAGVRTPKPHHFIDGVLIMELITDAEGSPAPRLAEVSLTGDEALRVFDQLLAEVVRMLCAGVVHGDFSDFNVLMGADGPVVIDFPQAVNAASNQNAQKLLMRDVANLHRFLSRFVPNQQPRPYAQEMWGLYTRGELTPDTRLSGRHRSSEKRANTDEVLELISDADRDERRRRETQGLSMRGMSPPPRRVEVVIVPSGPRSRARSSGRAVPSPGGSREGAPRNEGAPQNGNEGVWRSGGNREGAPRNSDAPRNNGAPRNDGPPRNEGVWRSGGNREGAPRNEGAARHDTTWRSSGTPRGGSSPNQPRDDVKGTPAPRTSNDAGARRGMPPGHSRRR